MRIGDIFKTAAVEGREKHVPFIRVGRGEGKGGTDVVHVTVGHEMPHPNTLEHHIAWVELFGVRKDGQVIRLGRADFAPGYTSPDVHFQVPVDEFKTFCALEYCNLHGVWESCLEL